MDPNCYARCTANNEFQYTTTNTASAINHLSALPVSPKASYMCKTLLRQIRMSNFDSCDLFSMRSFSSTFKLACEANSFLKSVGMWFSDLFTDKQATAALETFMLLSSEWNRRKTRDCGKVIFIGEVPPWIYVTDDSISEMEVKIVRFTQPSIIKPNRLHWGALE